MEDMRITSEGSGYTVVWPMDQIKAQVKLRSRKNYKCEVAWIHQGSSVHRSTWLLESTNAMQTCEKQLSKRRPIDDYGIDWSQVVEDMAGVVIDTVREGSPEVVLGDVETNDLTTWRIDNLLVEGANNLLWADGGTGKSYFALFLSTLLSEGYINTDHNLIVQPGRVLYCDYETEQRSMSLRVKKLHRGLGIQGKSKIVYRKMELPFTEDLDRIMDICHLRKIDVLIIDSMGMAMNQLEDAEAVQNFFRMLSWINARFSLTTLVISHANRTGTMFGSAYIHNSARCVYEARRTGGSFKSGQIDFDLFHQKGNDIPRQDPQSWSVSFGEDRVEYTRQDIYTSGAAGSLSYEGLVIKHLGGKDPQSRNREDLIHLIEPLKLPFEQESQEKVKVGVRSAVSKLKKSGVLVEDKETKLLRLNTEESNEKETGHWEA